MKRIHEIHPLSDFRQHTEEHLHRLRSSGEPELLTINGEAAVVVQDIVSYQKLLEAVDRAEAIVGIQRGLDSMSRNQGRPAAEAFDALRRRHDIPQSVEED